MAKKIFSLSSFREQAMWIQVTVICLVIIVILLCAGPGVFIRLQTLGLTYSNTYVAVYLDNNQVLYGHLRGLTSSTMKLTDVYYIQSVTVGETTTSNLIKRGTQEVSAPENFLMIDRAKISYWEAVGPKAQVMTIIHPTK
jgi:hypothetical protein